VKNPKAWPEKPLAALFAASPIFGTMIPPRTSGGEWLSLRVANIQNWQLDLSDKKYVSLPQAMIERHTVQDGDMLMARAIATQEHLGKSVVVYPHDGKWAFDSHLMRLRFDPAKAEPEFIRHLLMTVGGRQLFLKAARRSAVQYNINTKEISALRIPTPSISLQREFTARVAAVDRIKATQQQSLAKLDELFASLQHRAFRGEL
jgi:type I restriction enzyme S subunit